MGLDKLSDDTLDKLIKDAISQLEDVEPRVQSNVIELPVKPKLFHRTDLGNAERLIHYFGQDMRFCHLWGKWLIWDGKRWAVDTSGAAERLAQKNVREMFKEAYEIDDSAKRAELAKHAIDSESSGKVKSMLEMAKAIEGVSVSPDQLDSNPWVLNCVNGSVDLQAKKFRPHDRNDLITKLAPVEYDPKAKAPKWGEFLNRIMDGNQALIDFLQRAIGYSLTGSTREQCLFILHGSGANGKSTLLETIATLLEDGYAQQTPTSMLMIRRNEGIPNDVARLKGARFVSAVEAKEGQQLDESLVKQLTGGDRITARFMRAEFFEFRPEFKLWLGTNHKPEIRGTDHAIWRRIMLIPFNTTIPKNEQDPDLRQKLCAELPGILNWAIKGSFIWQSGGLNPPQEVCAAVEEYRAEQDSIGGFISERCDISSGLTVTNQALRKVFDEYCEETGAEVMSQNVFGRKLKLMGFNPGRTAGMRFWTGLALKEE